MGWLTGNPESPYRMNMNKPTPDTGTLPGTALETFGTTFNADAGRDAIHLATISVTSDETVFPSQHVGLVGEKKVSAAAAKLIGIVDPFLSSPVPAGTHFWLTLYPRTITSLRHAWTHPAFDDAAISPKTFQEHHDGAREDLAKWQASEKWLRDWLDGQGDNPGYEKVMRTIKEDWSDRDDDYVCGRMDEDSLFFGGTDAHGDIPPEFWEHVEVVLRHPPRHKPTYFSCSC
jgi:hypothetical protein